MRSNDALNWACAMWVGAAATCLVTLSISGLVSAYRNVKIAELTEKLLKENEKQEKEEEAV